jgi:hypothetical protein
MKLITVIMVITGDKINYHPMYSEDIKKELSDTVKLCTESHDMLNFISERPFQNQTWIKLYMPPKFKIQNPKSQINLCIPNAQIPNVDHIPVLVLPPNKHSA